MAAIFIMDSINANTLTEVTTVPTNKKLIFTDPDTNEGGIITMENLTKQVLQNLTSQAFALDAGNMTIPAALNALNGKTSINLLPIREDGSFSAALKGKNYVMIAGYFYTPSDCPFSFSVGYYIAFRSSYLVNQNVYTIVGINTNGSIECKTIQLQ